MMGKLAWLCLALLSLSSPLWALPVVSSSEVAYWLPASEEDARFTLEALNTRNRGPLQQILTGGLGPQTDNNPSKAGLRSNNFNPRESVKEALLGNFPHNTLLSRLLATNRKQYKKRGSLSECFWKYCV